MEILADESPEDTPDIFRGKSVRNAAAAQANIIETVAKFPDAEKTGYFKNLVSEFTKERSASSIVDDFKYVYKDYSGQAAINKLLTERKGYVPNAFERGGKLGNVGLIYGDYGRGLLHLIRQRLKKGVAGKDILRLLKTMEDVVMRGDIFYNRKANNYEVIRHGKKAVIEFLKGSNNQEKFVMTMFFEK